MNVYYPPPLPDLAERIKALGDPTGKTLAEIVGAIGYPQRELMTVSCVVEDAPFICGWIVDDKPYILMFDMNFRCLEYDEMFNSFLDDFFSSLSS
ncbi:MAG: hypothetical protein HDR72_04570 [Ruminococcaceae bacterium]|nr:hypothetical protein [Oscillospiraceae bacterium]